MPQKQKSIGDLREDAKTPNQRITEAYNSVDDKRKPYTDRAVAFMDQAVKDTPDILRRSAQARTDFVAKKAMKQNTSKGFKKR